LLTKEPEKSLTTQNDLWVLDFHVIQFGSFLFLQGSDDLLALFGIRTSKSFTAEQKNQLNRFFDEVAQYPSLSQKEYLANLLQLSLKQVSEWFHNKRKRVKKS